MDTVAKVSKKGQVSTASKLSPRENGRSSHSPNDATPESIAKRAYELFLARGGEPGRADDDWYQAERELRLGRN